MTPATKDLVSVLAPTASVLVAITALLVSWWVSSEQRRIHERQLKQNLYDKRYAIYLAAEEFLRYVLRVDGSIKPHGDEFLRFLYAVEQAEFLFKTDVIDYMKQLDKTVRDLHPKSFERDHLAAMKQQNPELDLEIIKVLMEIGGPFTEKRKQVFGPYLQLGRSERVEGSAAPMKLNGWKRLWVVVVVMWMLPVLVLSYKLWPITASISRDEVYARMKQDDVLRMIDYYAFLELHVQEPQKEMNQAFKAYGTVLSRVLTLKRAAFVGEAFACWIVPAIALYALGWAVGWVRRGFGL